MDFTKSCKNKEIFLSWTIFTPLRSMFTVVWICNFKNRPVTTNTEYGRFRMRDIWKNCSFGITLQTVFLVRALIHSNNFKIILACRIYHRHWCFKYCYCGRRKYYQQSISWVITNYEVRKIDWTKLHFCNSKSEMGIKTKEELTKEKYSGFLFYLLMRPLKLFLEFYWVYFEIQSKVLHHDLSWSVAKLNIDNDKNIQNVYKLRKWYRYYFIS